MNQTVLHKGEKGTPTIIIQQPGRRLLLMFLLFALAFSLMLNLGLLASVGDLTSDTNTPNEKFHSGDTLADAKIARIEANFMIMNPYTNRIIKAIKKATKDDAVKGVLLVIDSPGGLVSDSHEIYHQIKKLSEKKPVFVQMKGIAASGGYYIAMGAGPDAPVYVEPTTWTGSIGVIVPRYNVTELADKIGVKADSLATGPLKDTLNPLKEMSAREREVWDAIIQDSFDRFLSVIAENRSNLSLEQVRELATGQVYTANQAIKNGLADEISFEEDSLTKLQEKLGLKTAKVIDYTYPLSFTESLLSVTARQPEINIDPFSKILEASTPRAMYLFGSQHGLKSNSY
ncbi:signal peptide peptidase SppA [Thalassoglobus polymorphus]|uniref:Signal peptide peptidase SppA n=1 Tax=Thalassoglobus polymorphus TaxID=2527994 RepID=A0A517QSF4_9PLAN|nr:signal peptide peptidase SppA [Thalassoglobus polymorphus]QDT34554.1 Putative signal peptide peptidase SppA [Thalassoglobus polymorphus]